MFQTRTNGSFERSRRVKRASSRMSPTLLLKKPRCLAMSRRYNGLDGSGSHGSLKQMLKEV